MTDEEIEKEKYELLGIIQDKDKAIQKLEKENAMLKKLNSDEECLKRLAKKGYIKFSVKANEWHYPSKGEYPKCDEKTQLMFYVNCYYKLDDETVTIKRIVLGYYKKAFLRDDEKVFVEKSRGYEDEHLAQAVIAWKEIVLPKENE